MTNPLKLDHNVLTHAIKDRNYVNSNIDLHVEELKIKGYTIVESGLDIKFLDYVRLRIDEIYKEQCENLGGELNLEKINDKNIARAPSAHDKIFIDIAMNKPIHDICKRMLGEYFILMSQNAIINKPGTDHYQFTWHRDLNYQHYTSSHPLALSALLCIDPFSGKTGGTYVLEGTHLQKEFPSDQYVVKNQIVVEAPIGSIIVFDSMLFHRTGLNQSNIIRRAVNHIITVPMIAQQYKFSSMVEHLGDFDEYTKRFLGSPVGTAISAFEWRKTRIDR
ncbi:MAG: phytanoyl-CoA dioxygenase family protein [Alphaproteobacteria bacterium]|nr:phytanoyl-CoA dioxygenase family protein [Alphaproteobacteria bacterium]